MVIRLELVAMIKQLVFPRFIAAFLVLVFHFFSNYPGHSPITSTLFYPIFHTGDLAVVFFFTLSGFILSYVYFPKAEQLDLKQFYVFRLARIYPAYLLSILLYLLISLVYQKVYIGWYTFLLNILMVQSWVPNSIGLLNLAAWSVSVEVFFYVLFPFLLKGINALHINSLGLIILGIAIWLAYRILILPLSFEMNLPLGLRYLPVFVIGVISGIIFRKSPNPFPKIYFNHNVFNTTILAIAFLVSLYSYGIYRQNVNSVNDSVPVLIFTLLIVVLAWDSSFISRILSNGTLLSLGEISYGIYILQFPVKFWYEKLCELISFEPENLTISILFIPFLVGFAYLSFILIEEPIRLWVKRRFAPLPLKIAKEESAVVL